MMADHPIKALERLRDQLTKLEESKKNMSTGNDPFEFMLNPENTKTLSIKSGKKGSETSSEDDKVRDQILDALAALGKLTVGEDDLHFEGTKFVLPENMKGDIPGAIKYLRDWQEAQEAEFSFNRDFNYRPWDGANAFNNAMHKMWGSTGVGKSIQTMFGKIKPSFITIDTGVGERVQVPWGRVAFSPLQANFYLGATENEFGMVFSLAVEAPRKYRAHIEAFFALVEKELRDSSIYRGKAITGSPTPQFIDLSGVERERVIYTEDVMIQFETNMWSLLRYSDLMREHKIPLKRAVLIEGPYGTGKTLGGMLTAKEAIANGWTFIQARPGRDDLKEVLNTAQLYAPCVVWYEDIDIVAGGGDYKSISSLLDALDGVTNKGKEILAGFTTNYVEKLHKGVLRPGRLDAVIHVGGLDRDGFEKLVRVAVPEKLLASDVDFDAVAGSFEGFVPAFAKEAIDRAMRYSIARNHGVPGMISTDDLVNAANGLRPQLQLMQDAQEGTARPTLDVAMDELVAEKLNAAGVWDNNYDKWSRVKVGVFNGKTKPENTDDDE